MIHGSILSSIIKGLIKITAQQCIRSNVWAFKQKDLPFQTATPPEVCINTYIHECSCDFFLVWALSSCEKLESIEGKPACCEANAAFLMLTWWQTEIETFGNNEFSSWSVFISHFVSSCSYHVFTANPQLPLKDNFLSSPLKGQIMFQSTIFMTNGV